IKDVGVQFPINYHECGPWFFGLLMVLFSSFFLSPILLVAYSYLTGASAFPVFAVAYRQMPTLGLIILLVLGFLGLIFLLLGLAMFYSHKLKIELGQVTFQSKNFLRGSNFWKESLANYQSVLMDEIYHSGGSDSSSYTEYKVTLIHSQNPKRDIELFKSVIPDAVFYRQRAEAYAQLFKLPLGSNQDGKIEHRAVEDLNKKAKEMIKEKKIKYVFDPNKLPQISGFKVEKNGQGYLLEVIFPPALNWVIYLVGLFIAVASYFMLGTLQISLGILGIIVMAGLIISKKAKYIILLTNLGVQSFLQALGQNYFERSIDWKEVEEVYIHSSSGNYQNTYAKTVRIVSDQKSLDLGLALPEASLQWLRSCILYLIDKS
ncbi:MAG: hypothetical protein WCG27_09855, partial [Pseudomonadota bacterium]